MADADTRRRPAKEFLRPVDAVGLRQAGVPAGPVDSVDHAFALAEQLGLEPHPIVSYGDRVMPQVSGPLRHSAAPARYDLPPLQLPNQLEPQGGQ
jgi:hypothetical protein